MKFSSLKLRLDISDLAGITFSVVCRKIISRIATQFSRELNVAWIIAPRRRFESFRAGNNARLTAHYRHHVGANQVIKMDDQLLQLSRGLGEQLLQRNWRVATAESCTGGGVAAAITAVAGSSAWFEYGVVSYANSAKEKLLGVSIDTIAREGAVSEAVVIEMVRGVLVLSGADIAVAISGIAGPSGGSPEKPLGTAWFAWAKATGEIRTEIQVFDGDRAEVQRSAVIWALDGLSNTIKD